MKWKKSRHPIWTALVAARMEGVHSLSNLDLPEWQWVSDRGDSIIYPICGAYEALPFGEASVAEFSTLREAKEFCENFLEKKFEINDKKTRESYEEDRILDEAIRRRFPE